MPVQATDESFFDDRRYPVILWQPPPDLEACGGYPELELEGNIDHQ
jgi:hypothetical protein